MKPGKSTSYPDSLFKTWLEYRESKGQSRADVIREVNQKLDRKYDNDRFYKWLKTNTTVAENVMLDFVIPELPDVLKWKYDLLGYESKGIDFVLLSSLVRPTIKKLAHTLDVENDSTNI